MQIGSASSVDLTTLLGLTRFHTNTLDNTSAFSDDNITALLNQDYRKTQSFLLSELMFDWKENTLEGTGNGLVNLTAGTNNTTFPTGLITIDRIEVNYTGDENGWVVAENKKLEGVDRAVSNTSNNSPIVGSYGRPIYWVRDGVIYLDPIPNQDVTNGMKIYCTLLITDLAVGGAGDALTPVFATAFHELLAMGAAIKWLKQKKFFDMARELEKDRAILRGEMVSFYTNRQADKQANISAKRRNMF